jgi:phosphoglycolate phosphatase
VYIGDSEVDVRTAKNAGVTCIGVTWGFRDRAVLEREGADYIIDRPEELLKIIS